ncbi:hypothetical protein CMEL01_04228 [Colletotrichum melonis]|uniref:Uncharacterized protein n=2 Tax=Colletotrichum acutatum species complex TaxID=2707335 RepID=A0A9Q8T3Y5_9PEZI|nr:hypothetical protein CSPX01_16117 [Colletotrichum filicis]KAK1455468.1 hypothetical protein CMEL01_04228 [Colletotrichum melonis]UQC88458.1 hypothetical protein CLUP02_13982 [Colletotrichum lupini]
MCLFKTLSHLPVPRLAKVLRREIW